MTPSPDSTPSTDPPAAGALEGLLGRCAAALDAAAGYESRLRAALRRAIAPAGTVEPDRLERHQFAAHGFAWVATYVEALHRLLDWASGLAAAGRAGEREALILEIAFAEYLAQLAGGIALAPGEIVRPGDFGPDGSAAARLLDPAAALFPKGATGRRERLCVLLAEGGCGEIGGLGEALDLFRDELRRFVVARVLPQAPLWHEADRLIPLDLIAELAALGVFGVTVAEESGGLGLGRLAMCVVSEELSRGSLALGSLGTRSEIAAELIGRSGTAEQRARYLPGIAGGAILPTAVFTEPGAGSDLAAVTTKAVRAGGAWRVSGAKTWITHGARSDLMTLLVRTGSEPGHRGLSILLADKPRGSEAEPFPAPGMSGSEIRVLGYRGMKEYEIAFDGFAVPEEGLLGGRPGEGFRQLMATFETARIQTASRAVGVAQNALDLALAYAAERRQFGRPIAAFPRVSGKLGWMAAETMLARQLAYHAAREKDRGRRCDIVAGMAKLLAARVAWSNADNGVQIHGGNGYALEYPISRVLLDARILAIFEGAAEIQAQVIARGLLEARN